MATISVTLFVALFSLLSYRMYAGLDPSIGNDSATTNTAIFDAAEKLGDELLDIEDEAEDDFDSDSDESFDDAPAESSPSTSTTTTTPPQPTTRAS